MIAILVFLACLCFACTIDDVFERKNMGRISKEDKAQAERLKTLREKLDKATEDLAKALEGDNQSPSKVRGLQTLIDNYQTQISAIESKQGLEEQRDYAESKDALIQTANALDATGLDVSAVKALQEQVITLQNEVQRLENENNKLVYHGMDNEQKVVDRGDVLDVFFTKITSIDSRQVLAVLIIMALGRQRAKSFLDKWDLGSYCSYDIDADQKTMLEAIIGNEPSSRFFELVLEYKHKIANPRAEAAALQFKQMSEKQEASRKEATEAAKRRHEAEVLRNTMIQEQDQERRDSIAYEPPQPQPRWDAWGNPIGEPILPV
jgi:hypothetical protein